MLIMPRCLVLERKGVRESYSALTTTSQDITRARGQQLNTCPRDASMVDELFEQPKLSLSTGMLPKAASVEHFDCSK